MVGVYLLTGRTPASRTGKQRVGVDTRAVVFLCALAVQTFSHIRTVPRTRWPMPHVLNVRCATRTRDARRFHLHNQHNDGLASLCLLFTFVVTGVADIENMYSVLKVSERAQRVRRYTLPSRVNRSDALCLPRVHLHALSRPSAPPTRFNLGPDSRDQRPRPSTAIA